VIYTEIWQSLEASFSTEGYVRRRMKPESVCGLFLAVTKPPSRHLLHIQMKEVSPPSISSLPSVRGFDVTVIPSGNEQDGFIIQLALKDGGSTTIFDVLISDIVEVLAHVQSESVAVVTLSSRLRRWQKFLEQIGPDGLSRESQQGLYGELWFLRERLIPLVGSYPALLAWAGPTGAHHDFILQSRAIEVKTTGTKEPQHMIIQSERQLDDSGLAALFLFHLAMDIREGAGESLITMIDSLQQTLKVDTTALDLFEDCLFEAGFLQAQAAQYERTGYHVRRAHLFQVRDAFPRIIGADLKPGVGSVRYSITVTECRHFAVTEGVLKSELQGLDHGK
jgi:Putative  PD-(D/E)XK family member, (DUF4420)